MLNKNLIIIFAKKRRLGPGYYNIKQSSEIECYNKKSQRGMLDALSERFSDNIQNNNPGKVFYFLLLKIQSNYRINLVIF